MPGNIALVDVFKPHMDGTVVEVNERMEICNIIPGALQTEEFDYKGKYKTVNVYSFQADYLQNWVGVEVDKLAIGNGASEIIAAIKRTVLTRMTVAVPTFNEYYDGLPDHKINFYHSEPNDFTIDLLGFAESVEQSGSNVAVLVNPDLPSGLMVKKPDLAKLLHRLAHLDLVLVDESFIDFAGTEEENSLIADLELYPNLLVIRSLSKDLGVPGLRLGYAASSNQSLVNLLRREMPIWNINGLAEYFLAVLPKYRREFEESRRQVIADREYFYARLIEVPGIGITI